MTKHNGGWLTHEATLGYNAAKGAASPYLSSSNCDSAWHIGAYLRSMDAPAPFGVRPSRGYTFHANGMKFRMIWADKTTKVQRID